MGLVENAIVTLTNYCDRASSLDGMGWNKIDTHIGHSLTQQILSGKTLTFKQRKLIAKILPKYHGQFHNWDEIKETIPSWVKEGERVYREKQIKEKLEGENLPKLSFKNGYFFIKTSYNDNWIPKGIPKRRWIPEEKIWRFLNTDEVKSSIMEVYDKFKTITPEASEELKSFLYRQKDIQHTREIANRIKLQESVELDIPLLKTRLFEHQKKAVKIGTILDSSALLMEQGTGKTLAAIAIATHRYMKGQVQKLLIIAPKSVLPEWARQFKEHTDLPYEAHPLDSIKRDKKINLIHNWEIRKGLKVLVVNYESVWRLEEDLIKWNPDMIICDESQKIKNARAKQSRSIIKLGKKVKYRLILTGTPVTQNPMDLFSQYQFLDPTIFGNSFTKFRDRYAIMGGFNGYQYMGPKNTEELANKAHSIAYRVTKDEALDLPPEIHQNLYAELEPEAAKRYKELAEDSILKLEGETVSAPIVLTQLMRLQQITGGFIKTEEGSVIQVSKAKLDILKETIEELVINNGKKVVIFSRFIPEIEAISKILSDMNIRHHTITGATKDRGKLINDFQNNPETKAFVINPKAGGTGITLTAADTAIFYSKDYSLETYLQAMARIHRIGQKNKVTYIHIIARGTVDESVTERLNNKQDLADLVVDDLKTIIFKEENNMESKKLEEKLNSLKEAIENGEEVTSEAISELNELDKEVIETKDKEEKATKGKKSRKPKKEKAPKAKKEKPAKEAAEPTVTVADIAEDLGLTPTVVRKKLRDSGIKKPSGGRWEWPVGHADIEAVKNLFVEEAKSE